ncbi:Uncharacterised protein [Mycobacteroides abscessus subsp. abscessus]|nr:Uncharacterised protein [Mycobacteroides abscessus subsp. abscessus]
MSRSLAVMPPSTFNVVNSRSSCWDSASARMASTTSRVWKAVDSSTARARCALVTNRVRPAITPRASGRQRGANRPEKAGTM